MISDRIRTNEITNNSNSTKLNYFILGFSFSTFFIFIILGESSNKLFLPNIVGYMKVLKQIGWIGLFFLITYMLVFFSLSLNFSKGFSLIPILFILLPIISSDLFSFISVTITILLIVLFSFYIIKKIPLSFMGDVISQWEWVLGIVLLGGGIYLFLSHYFPTLINNYTVKEFKEKIDEATCTSVFIYTFFNFCILYLKRKQKKSIKNN